MPKRKKPAKTDLCDWHGIALLQRGGLEEIAKIVEKGPHAYQMQEIGDVLSTLLGREVGWKGAQSPWH